MSKEVAIIYLNNKIHPLINNALMLLNNLHANVKS